MVSFAAAAAGGNRAWPGGIGGGGAFGFGNDSQPTLGNFLSTAVRPGNYRRNDADNPGVRRAGDSCRDPFCMAQPRPGDRNRDFEFAVWTGRGLPDRRGGRVVLVAAVVDTALIGAIGWSASAWLVNLGSSSLFDGGERRHQLHQAGDLHDRHALLGKRGQGKLLRLAAAVHKKLHQGAHAG